MPVAISPAAAVAMSDATGGSGSTNVAPLGPDGQEDESQASSVPSSSAVVAGKNAAASGEDLPDAKHANDTDAKKPTPTSLRPAGDREKSQASPAFPNSVAIADQI